jgi:hypothetical protein
LFRETDIAEVVPSSTAASFARDTPGTALLMAIGFSKMNPPGIGLKEF